MNITISKTQFEFTNEILALEPKKMNISSTEKLILLQLSLFIDSSRRCFPSHSKLAQLTGFSKSTVIRALDKLVVLKLINKKKRSNQYGNTSNLYELLPKTKIKASKIKNNAAAVIPFISTDGRKFDCPADFYLQGVSS
ncbi:helix-turn-helix domain-containing protein [Pseudoalteromonas spongiae]|uniref:helix-turn-helix domain-containing protein n=1 Tax=Pseudoalteromonas spongiae TaxID=298657 RepID=UPI00110B132D|nr:helix-turn-helix domain-containing protein [Pseudoalteromonas spongiae]TMO82448.1 hypothetical protein CWC15_19590 [Pseudoalteromonas spongiae]